MSTGVLARAHIDVLVLAGVQFGVMWDGGAQRPAAGAPGPAVLAAAGAELWRENHRALDRRYRDRAVPPPYSAPTAEVILDPVRVVKAVDCYVHQSSGHPGWPVSWAADYCRRLRAAAINGLPLQPGVSGEQPRPAGWGDAPGSIESLGQAALGPWPGPGADGGRP